MDDAGDRARTGGDAWRRSAGALRVTLSAEERAQRSAAAMWRDDGASAWLGMRLEGVGEGRATLSLAVESHHANGHGMCHGGITFALADSAFAFACNSRNRRAVAQHNAITYLAPARVGDTLTAEAAEVSLSGRSGVYDVRVSDQNGTAVAVFRGLSRIIEGTLFDEDREDGA